MSESNVSSASTRQRRELIDKLAELGSTQVSEDDVRFEGSEFILPKTMDVNSAISYLQKWQDGRESQQCYRRTFDYRPWDGAMAVQSVLRKLTGTGGIGKATFSLFFGSQPPPRISIKVGPGQTEQVPWGGLDVPLFEGSVHLETARHPEYGPLFAMEVYAPRKLAASVEGFLDLIKEELETNSIYRGKAIDGQTEAEFLDLSGVSREQVVYSEDVLTQLDANIWSLLRHTEEMRELGIPLKRAVLLEGPYGTGKTLAGHLTAQLATEHGWTYIYCRPERDDLHEVMGMARLYQPAVVFFEDVDTVGQAADSGVSKLLDTFDGLQSKGTEILAVLTTNHADKIHKGMVRPGRLDAVIHIGALDQSGIEKLVKSAIPAGALGKVDYELVAEAMQGFMPAFCKEAVDRAARYSIARNDGKLTTLGTADFVAAAEGLVPQLRLMEGAAEDAGKDTLATALASTVTKALDGSKLLDYDDDEMYTLSTNGRR